MEFTSLARRIEIGANSYWLRVGGKNLVLDCGLHPKDAGLEALPDYGLLPPETVDAVVVTHAHQDHIGSLPILTRREQVAPVFMTPATARIGETMLHNSVNVMMRQREEENVDVYPLFTHRGVDLSAGMWRQLPVRQPVLMSGERGAGGGDEPSIEFFNAGHILGSVGVMIRHGGRSLFYTGDVNFEAQTLMLGADFPTEPVDVLVMETTRGDSPMPEGFTRKGEEERFARALKAAFERGGGVTIPVFALGKTQELLTLLWQLRRSGRLAHVPVYIGGLSTKITAAYDALVRNSDRGLDDLLLLHEMAPYVLSGSEAGTMPVRKNCIYALSSGMMTEHTLSNIFVRKVLPDPDQTLFFVGYSDPESPAGRVRSAKLGDKVVLDPTLPPVELRCRVENFNFSAHASRESLRDYAVRLRPKKILFVHGDVPAVEWFRTTLMSDLPDSEMIVPPAGTTISL
jgi:Cft2 family RNA processing exonuclease